MVHRHSRWGAHPSAPTQSLWAKVGQPQLPSTGHISSRVVLMGQPGTKRFSCPGSSDVCASTVSLLLLLSPSPSLSLHAFSPSEELASSCLGNCCSSALPTGSPVLGSVFLAGAGVAMWGPKGELVWMERRKACQDPGLSPRSLGHGPFRFFLTWPSPSLGQPTSPVWWETRVGSPCTPVPSSSTSPLLTACNPGACHAVEAGPQPKGVRVQTADFKVCGTARQS